MYVPVVLYNGRESAEIKVIVPESGLPDTIVSNGNVFTYTDISDSGRAVYRQVSTYYYEPVVI